MSNIKESYRHISIRVRAYDQFSTPFVLSSGLGQGHCISLFLIFPVEDILQEDLSGLLDDGIELFLGNRFFDNIALLNDIAQTIRRLRYRDAVCSLHLQNTRSLCLHSPFELISSRYSLALGISVV